MSKILLLLVGFVLGVGSLYVYETYWIDPIEESQSASISQGVDISMAEAFRYTLEEEIVKKQGAPTSTQGYEPPMFLAVFPGLSPSDFSGVEARVGWYELQGGVPVFVADGSRLGHAGAKAISRAGIETLLKNIASRNNIQLSENGTLTDIIRIITRE